MSLRRAFLRDSELDRSSYPELRDRVIAFEQDPSPHETRSYPGYPETALPRCRPRPLTGLEKTLASRRCVRRLGRGLPSKRDLGRLLQFAHGVSGGEGRGPVPSSGGLQSLELYAAAFDPSWLPPGVHHYDRAGHRLSQILRRAERERWRSLVPAMDLVEGGALLWIIVGDAARIGAKYGDRGGRFLLIEAGHLMQNLCLMSASLGLSTVPLGGALEPEIARELELPETDAVLYVGLCGTLVK
ncbi:MAG: SagB family peptide dehydrogenase [Planctomycetes bacterium]|nr:SagB family peptide dehydrogenase [Planctomycetota bacterium]